MVTKSPVTAATAMFTFYDIESLNDAFTLATYTPRTNCIELFYLVDETSGIRAEIKALTPTALIERMAKAVFAANPALHATPGNTPRVSLYDLATQPGVETLATRMGLFDGVDVNDRGTDDSHSGKFRPVCDTWSEYDPFNTHPFMAGYNSYAYDTTMLAVFFNEATGHAITGRPFEPKSPALMREHNNELFSDRFRSFMPSYLTEGNPSIIQGKRLGWDSPSPKIRKALLDSGRHIDVARLNEGQRQVGLKRLLGGMGRQILESDKLGSHNATVKTLEGLIELLAYNVSDVVGLAKLFEHPSYSSTFDLKIGLMNEYPETVYKASYGKQTPRISPGSVRMGRLTPDSTSAKFVARILAPYKDLSDIDAVSFLYPSEKVAAETGVERRNVLADAITFFRDNISMETDAGKKAHTDFDKAMEYYQSIEGQNFNDEQGHVTSALGDVPRTPNNLPYYNLDGTPSNCFVTFSTGGIHGAEYDEAAFAKACQDSRDFNTRLDEIKALYPEPTEFWTAHPAKNPFIASDEVEMPRGHVLTAKTSLKTLKAELEDRHLMEARITDEGLDTDVANQLRTEHAAQYDGVGYRPYRPMAELFETAAKSATKLKPAFSRTSAAKVTHEDFTSYYPNMLRNMGAFYNPDLGEDRYAAIFENKERYGRQMKQPGISPEEKARLSVLRNGTKLILNSASGAGDTAHKNPIRMNNQIISMRIIGQLFSWRIGQAQTLVGAHIISTNTDGLYSDLEDLELNNRVLAEQSDIINVEIEPEPMWLISKDSNNRLELEIPEDGAPMYEAPIITASGGTLACHNGPQPTKSLAHPAVIDWALARYLREIVGGRTIDDKELRLHEQLNREVALWLMTQARDATDSVFAARLFQNVLAASAGKLTFPFATYPDQEPKALQHFNRVFVMKPGTPNTASIQAAGAWVVTEASRKKRKADGIQTVVLTDPVATPILAANGFTRDGSGNSSVIPADQDVAVRRVPRLDPSWSMRVDNRDLVELLTETIRGEILNHLDLEVYVDMLATTFEENWMNTAH